MSPFSLLWLCAGQGLVGSDTLGSGIATSEQTLFLPSALGLMAFLTELLSIELHPAQGCNRH
ncbi:MAG: hypothetical protein WCH01_13835 [Methylococcaceae bacterium]